MGLSLVAVVDDAVADGSDAQCASVRSDVASEDAAHEFEHESTAFGDDASSLRLRAEESVFEQICASSVLLQDTGVHSEPGQLRSARSEVAHLQRASLPQRSVSFECTALHGDVDVAPRVNGPSLVRRILHKCRVSDVKRGVILKHTSADERVTVRVSFSTSPYRAPPLSALFRSKCECSTSITGP